MQLTLCVCEDWTNECYDNDIGQLKQCKDNEVCYFKKWSVGFISSYGSFERRSCEPRENHRINFCGKDDFWMKDEVVYDTDRGRVMKVSKGYFPYLMENPRSPRYQ